jgi:hypothetical protein
VLTDDMDPRGQLAQLSKLEERGRNFHHTPPCWWKFQRRFHRVVRRLRIFWAEFSVGDLLCSDGRPWMVHGWCLDTRG